MTSAVWTLAAAGVPAGCLAMWAFRRLADREALGAAFNRIQAHLLEFWLFVDEPRVVWRSWRGLLAANARFLRLLLVPLVVLAIPMTPLYFVLDAIYGYLPLPVGEPAVVTLKLTRPLEQVELKAPDGIAVEGPPVRVTSAGELSWRIRPLREVSGELEWTLAGSKLEKSVGGNWIRWSRSRFLSGPVAWIEVPYPPASVAGMHWSIWFLAFSLAGALIIRDGA